MAMTDAKRKTDKAWQQKNYKMLSVKLYKEDAEEFTEYCKENNISVNAALKKYISECIDRPLTVRSEARSVEGQQEVSENEED